MSIFSRLSDIINSNLNAILDRAEDPEKMIRLVIQEMEDTLVEVRTNAARTIAERKEVDRKLNRLEELRIDWQERAELALTRDREDLAKAALVEKAKLADTAKLLREERTALDEAIQQGDQDISKLQAKLSEAKAKQQSMVTRQQHAGARLKVRRTLYDGRVDDALSRFEQIERKLDEAEGKVEAYELGRQKSLQDEISDLEIESRIEQEMSELKARVGARRADNKAER